MVIGILSLMPVDLYVPALPGMQRELGISASLLNLTMFVFFFGAAFSVAVAGPLSDRYGRKPVLIVSCSLFCASSLVCAAAGSVAVLVAGRIGQAVAYGFELTLQTAVVRDEYSGKDLKIAMTLVQSLVIIGPATAPFLGSLLVAVFGWREVFLCLAAMGLVCLALALTMSETLDERYRTSGTALHALHASAPKVKDLLAQRQFTSMMLIMSLAAVPYFAWIATVSYDLLDFYSVDYLDFSACYAATSLMTVAAPYVYMALSKRLGSNRLLLVCIAVFTFSLLLLAGFGTRGALLFTLSFLPFALGEGIVRPMAYVHMLQQPSEYVGAASVLANFSYNIMSSVATVMATLPWCNFIFGLTVLYALSLAGMIACYFLGLRGQELREAEQAA